MKLLVTGASGLFGSKLADLAVRRGYEVFSFFSQHKPAFGFPVNVSVADRARVLSEFDRVRPDVVVHAASMTDVDRCELDKPLAWRVNVEGTEHVASAAKACGAFLLYVSTDYVFDGEKGCYSESDLPSPISYYAYSKLKAEEHVRGILGEGSFCVARPSVISGANPAAGKVNFGLWLLEKLRKRERAKVFVDQWNSPTLNSSLAEMTLEACERRLTGVWHLSGATRISRFDFAVELARVFGLDSSVFEASALREMRFLAKRPRDSSLNTSKAEKALRSKPLAVDVALMRLRGEVEALG